MTVQDDSRENELIQLFNLERPVNLTRSGADAILILHRLKIPFLSFPPLFPPDSETPTSFIYNCSTGHDISYHATFAMVKILNF